MSCLILFKSITYAQSALYYIVNNGMNANLIRKPCSINGNGCGYALKTSCKSIDKICKLLDQKYVDYISVWRNVGLEWVKVR